MKKIFFSVMLLSSTALFAQYRQNYRNRNHQSNQPPSTVQQTFQRENPNVNETWSRSNNQWHAKYKDNNDRDVDAYYDGRGRRQESHIAWKQTEVPQEVDKNVNRRYHTNGNYQVTRIERPNNKPLFQINIHSGRSRRKVYMDEQGRNVRYTPRY